jgi:hypothetical protein
MRRRLWLAGCVAAILAPFAGRAQNSATGQAMRTVFQRGDVLGAP